MTINITFRQVFILITVVWILLRIFFNVKRKKTEWKYECKLITVYICIIVITRLVYFPWQLENGHIGLLHFDSSKILPFWINTVPFTFLTYVYEGWQRNVFGNIAMFIPVGLAWPFCFKKLDSIGKVLLAGFGYSMLIETSQLLFYERGSDIDDLILNTTGVLIGACIYFLIAAIRKRHGDEKNKV